MDVAMYFGRRLEQTHFIQKISAAMPKRLFVLVICVGFIAACSGSTTQPNSDTNERNQSGDCAYPPCPDFGQDSSDESPNGDTGNNGDSSDGDDTDGSTDTGSDGSEDGGTDEPPSGEVKHPLPLASNWNNSPPPGFGPEWQIKQIREGHKLLFTYEIRPRYSSPSQQWKEKNKPIVKTLKDKNAPIALNWGNWESAVENGGGSNAKENWRSAGKSIINGAKGRIDLLEKWYPDPPYVLMVSNNEVDANAPDGKGVEMRQAMFNGMREAAETWGDKFRFIGYMWGGQANINIASRDTSALAWDGTSARNYRDRSVTDHTAYSTPVTAMNLVVKKYYYRWISDSPHLEVSTWWRDKKSVAPVRYGGMTTWSLWVCRPKTLRDFASSTTTIDGQSPYYSEIVGAVDQVHNNDTLRRFWTKGRRVVNKNIEVFTHVIDRKPWNGKPKHGSLKGHLPREKLEKLERLRHNWYHLPTSLDPPDPAPNSDKRLEYPEEAEFKVWAQAKVLGEKPNREWLLYAYAPKESQSGVDVTIPKYKKVTFDIPQAGVFVHVDEQQGGIVNKIEPADIEF